MWCLLHGMCFNTTAKLHIVVCTAAMHPAGHVKMAVSETRRKPVGNFRWVPQIVGPARTPRRKPIGNYRKDLHGPCYICDCSHLAVRIHPEFPEFRPCQLTRQVNPITSTIFRCAQLPLPYQSLNMGRPCRYIFRLRMRKASQTCFPSSQVL